LLAAIHAAIAVFFPELGSKSFRITLSNLLEMLSILPPFLFCWLIGCMD
jgi:hypothetical protein